MKLAILVDALHSIAAGSERQICKLAEGLTRDGHDVRLILLRHNDFSRQALYLSCPVDCVQVTRILGLETAVKLRRLRARLVGEGVELVHAFFPDACLLAPLYLKHPALRVVTSRRDMGLIYQGKPAWLYRLLGPRTDAVVANSRAVAELVTQREHLPANRCIVIHNGIEPYSARAGQNQSQLYRNDAALKLMLVANIKPVKRTLDAVMAMRQLLAEGAEVELALVGQRQDAAYAERIDAYIREHQLEHRIHRLGQVDEPRRLLRQADIGLLISESEGLSNTLMEYLQLGLAVVATRVGGNPELIAHGETGLLIERGNVDQLVAAIRQLAAEPALRTRLGKAGRQLMEQEFSIAAMLARHEDLYRNLVEQRKGTNAHVEC